MTPKTLGRYQVLERLGQGGMGVVYAARDPRLDREVAIKVLPEDSLRDEAARRRFRNEARVLSRVLHPNVATLFDFDTDGGVDFLVMEHVSGETLLALLARGRLSETQARAIGSEVGEALMRAHEEGVVHGDLKPGNVMLSERGHAKVLDFGLARVLGVQSTTAELPRVGGTLPYMAPEQLQGGLERRSDIYALGTLLFEMLTAQRVFPATALPSLVYDILHSPPPRVRSRRADVSVALDVIVACCLEKEPSARFADAATLVAALRAPISDVPTLVQVPLSSAQPRIRSLAVLPLENRSGDPAQEFFADGMTEALISDLAQIAALKVISRTSAMAYKGVRQPLPKIAQELGVDALVEGSVLRAGDRVKVTVQLVDASDRSLWGRSYEREMTDVLTLLDEMAGAIVDELRVQVTPDEQVRMQPRGKVRPEAHVAYLEGRYLWNKWSPEALLASIPYFERALAVDPDYALAWAGLADSYAVLGNTNVLSPQDAYQKARDAAERGLALDEGQAELHASLAYVTRFFDWDWPRTERELRRAIELNPGYATGRRWYAQFLSGMGRHEQALIEAERALELDPLSLIIHTAVGDVLFYARRYAEAVTYYRKCLAMDPQFGPGHTDLARALEHLGQPEEALAEFLKATPPGGAPRPSTGLAILQWRAERKAEAWATLQAVLSSAPAAWVSPYGVASFYAVAGEVPTALDWLERAHAERDGALVLLKVHPRLDSLRGEARFSELLRSMKFSSGVDSTSPDPRRLS